MRKCYACGYIRDFDFDMKGNIITIGDEDFIKISGSTFKKYIGYGEEKEIKLIGCPKCGTIKIDGINKQD